MPTGRIDKRRRNTRRTNIIVASAAAGLLLLVVSYLWLLGGTMPSTVPAIGGPFTLTQGNGQVVTDQDFRGQYLLIYFGYTSCPDVCPTTLSAIADAIGILGIRAERVQPLFITVDPAHDTPAIMRDYVRSFSPRIIGLTGSSVEIRAVEQEYRITAIDETGAGKSDDTISHTAVLFFVSSDGRYLTSFAATESSAELAKDLAHYMGE